MYYCIHNKFANLRKLGMHVDSDAYEPIIYYCQYKLDVVKLM